ncbi:MAG: hypothetical protein EA384_16165 [Spirochaetaceae bacterium]|nr:MAG: hypothetical protein EA384_16165 [Spirochaetaceae bacterium]
MRGREAARSLLILTMSIFAVAACSNPTGNSGGGGDSAVPENYRVLYFSNGATNGALPEDSAEYQAGAEVTVLPLDPDEPLEKDGSQFAGWNTAPDGSGDQYRAGDTFAMPGGDETLYAQWVPEGPVSYAVAYDGNQASGGDPPADDTEYFEGEAVTVMGNTGGLVREEDTVVYTFAGWNTAPDGSGDQYRAGDTFAMPGGDETLYAQWSAPLADDDDLKDTFRELVDKTITGDSGSGFEPVEGQDGAYEWTGTGGASIRFWRINASGTISFETVLDDTRGSGRDGDIEIYRVEPDGGRGDLIALHTVNDQTPTTIQFEIPDSDFAIGFQGGQRDWVIRDFELTLD